MLVAAYLARHAFMVDSDGAAQVSKPGRVLPGVVGGAGTGLLASTGPVGFGVGVGVGGAGQAGFLCSPLTSLSWAGALAAEAWTAGECRVPSGVFLSPAGPRSTGLA